ncbi:MAG: hypothetical protein GY708_21175 [Actinomycetia bacterium]|nr:hypothetical protein [Actinomycetes bacterium]MCP4963437.1 hypothetical protein [Actinomycetes bacterium]
MMFGAAFNGTATSDVGTGEPETTSDAQHPVLGPIQLVANLYTSQQSVPCVRGSNSADPVGCSQTFTSEMNGFTFESGATIVCAPVGGWSFDSVKKCQLNGAGHVQLDVDLVHSNGITNLPCDDPNFGLTIWATVTVTNPNGDSITISIFTDNNEKSGCVLPDGTVAP